ncbi:MAG: vWA domain-containing protein [Acidimicrobiales bacterium]
MLDLLAGFVAELRQSGLPVSLTEHLDAADAMRHVHLDDRDELKYALGATLVKSSSHWRAFETAFEIYFAPRHDGAAADASTDESATSGIDRDAPGQTAGSGSMAGQGRGRGGGGAGMSAQELAELLYRAILSGDAGMAGMVARHAVDRYAGMEPGRPVGGTYYLYRTLRNLDLDGVLARLVDEARGSALGSAGLSLTPLEERLVTDAYKARLKDLQRTIESEIRRRLVADRGAEALLRSVRTPLPEDIDVMHATRDELAALKIALHPLSRKLAVRLARKRRHRHRGPLDFRATVRRSLSTGGVPVEPRFRHPHPSKPEIFVIADVSGSVASFARFTLLLVHAISSQFSKVRSFVFVDGIDEVTRFFEGADDPSVAVHRINTEADVVWVDGHSDYGHALTVFNDRWGDEVTSKASILVLGDARNNYHASHAWVLADLRLRARHVYWLNPEPTAYWGSGDSIVDEYGTYCDAVVECRTLRQLERFVGGLE